MFPNKFKENSLQEDLIRHLKSSRRSGKDANLVGKRLRDDLLDSLLD